MFGGHFAGVAFAGGEQWPASPIVPRVGALLVDWDNDGRFLNQHSDVTKYLQSVQVVRGRDVPNPLTGRAELGKLQARALNHYSLFGGNTSVFSPLNPASGLFGKFNARPQVRWYTKYGLRWTGYLDDVNPTRLGNTSVVDITASGPFSKIMLRKISPAPQAAGTLTGAIIGAIATAAGWTGTTRFDAGQQSCAAWFVVGRDAMDAGKEIEITELGYLGEGSDGALEFQDRNYRLTGARLNAVSSYTDAQFQSTVLNPYTYSFIEQINPTNWVVNEAVVSVTPLGTPSTGTLWTLTNETPVLAPGQSFTWIANAPNSTSPSGAYYVSSWTTPVVGTDITQTGVANGDIGVTVVKTATQMFITIINNNVSNSATLTLVQARGTLQIQGSQTSVQYDDATSQLHYGVMALRDQSPWLPNTNSAQAYVQSVVTFHKDVRPALHVKFLSNLNSTLFADLMSRDIGDRVSIDARRPRTGLGFVNDWFIERLEDSWDCNTGRLETDMYLSAIGPESLAATPWKVGTSALDTATILGF